MGKEKIKEEKKETEEKPEESEAKFKQIKNEPKKVERNLEKMVERTKKKRKIRKILIIATVITIAIVALVSTIFALLNMNKTSIVSGVKIEGIDVSGLSKSAAKEKLENIYKEKLEKEIPAQYTEYETTINATVLETTYKIDEAVDKAISIGREDNIFINNYKILWAMLGKTDFKVEMQLNEEIARKTIEDIGTNLPGVMVESAYYIEDGKLKITKGQEGIKIDSDAMLEKIKNQLDNIEITNKAINIPVQKATPAKIDIDKIHTEVYKEVKDAYYTKDPFTIYPEVEGVDFDVEAARQLLETDQEEYVIDLIITKPKVTTDQIGTEAFPDQLGTFKTNYDGGDVDRTTNLRLACEKINGKVVLAGETFSYNKTLGPRSAATGYKNAKVYSAGEVVDGIGGGICQISSTLYNAVLRANLGIVERRNHQFVTSYVEAGMDATVVYGTTDFKFKNTRKYPIKIVASAKNGVATVSIYGIKEAEEYTFSFRTVTISTLPTSTKYIDDPTLAPGVEVVKQKGANGRKTETYMYKMLNGKIVSTTVLSRDTYDPMQKIIIRGTKGQATTSTTTPSTQQTPSTDTTTQTQTTPQTDTSQQPEATTPTTPSEPSEPSTESNQGENSGTN